MAMASFFGANRRGLGATGNPCVTMPCATHLVTTKISSQERVNKGNLLSEDSAWVRICMGFKPKTVMFDEVLISVAYMNPRAFHGAAGNQYHV